jgi:phage-related protein
MANPEIKPVRWMGDSKEELCRFPVAARKEIGNALYFAQAGDKHPAAKPLKGFGGAGVLEIVENYDGDTYRVVYTVRFAGILYVLHSFQKKSKRGRTTPKSEIELVKQRLKAAQIDHASNSTI